jgi:1,4-dihydroxy-2-naphthoate octaprenyltransferase
VSAVTATPMPSSAAPATPTGWRLWVAGARPRTLGAAVAPVAVGTGIAAADGDVVAWRAVLALVVSLALQVGVNYANDYSDGVRGTDVARRGPVRLTASGLAAPAAVKRAAGLAFLVAAAAGLALAVAVSWWLVAVGAGCIAAAALYTGGPRPYGYEGFGEVAVLVFFGLVATVGSAYVHLERIEGVAVAAGAVVGLLACAILLANNIRDVATDSATGKRTLAVRIGARPARLLYVAVVVAAFAGVAAIGAVRPPALVALAAVPLAVAPARAVLDPASPPPRLVGALVGTARLELVTGFLLALGLGLS